MAANNLWAPWRMDYINGLDTGGESRSVSSASPECFLCTTGKAVAGTPAGDRALLLMRDERGVILLNRYPYTNGHLLVAPTDHVADLTDMSHDQRAGLMDLVARGVEIIRLAYNPQGFNVGINLGRCAGAGLPGHIHIHIVPRWNGDTNFMTVVGEVRVVPQAIEASFRALREATAKLAGAK